MSNLAATIHDSWEKTLFAVTALAVASFLGYIAFNFLKDGDEATWQTAQNKEPFRYFDMRDSSYMETASLAKDVNPLSFSFKVVLPAPKPVETGIRDTPAKETRPAPQPPKNNGPKTAAVTPKTPQSKPAPSAPKPPPRIISVRYRGFVQGGNEEIAFYVATDSNGKKTEAKAARSGAAIHGILEIKSFDSERLTLQLGGKDVVVNKGKKQDFVIQ